MTAERDWIELASVVPEMARRLGASYADVRFQASRQQRIVARNDRIQELEDEERTGLGVRCLAGGAWGFAAVSVMTPDSVAAATRRAVESALATAPLRDQPVVLAEETPHQIEYHTPRREDPFAVGLSEKTALLLECARLMRAEPEIREAWALLSLQRQEQFFLSTEGSRVHRTRIVPWAMLYARAAGNGDVQTRMYDTWGRHAGWEHIREADLLARAPVVAREAREKLYAEEISDGRYDLILDPAGLVLPIHESIGHATELDRVLGYEADFAGTSFATPEKLGNFRYGSPILNVVADNTRPEYLASQGCDDEGVEGQRWDVIREGILTGYSTGREFAPLIGEERSRGSSRAEGWWYPPIVRIPNLGILPGSGRYEDLIADTSDGILVEGRGAFSIDQQRLDFQFGGDMTWRIKDGKRQALLKNVVYRGRTPVFWNSCDAVCGPEDFDSFGLINCGKGQPAQRGMMTHFAPPCRFRKVEFGKAKA